MFILAQCLGIAALVITVLSFYTKNRIIFIALNLTFNVILSIQYFLLHSPISGLVCIFAAFRYIIYIFKGQNKLLSGIWIPIIFIIANLAISIFTFQEWYDIFPAISAISLSITAWFDNVKVLKIGSIAVCPLWFVFDIMVSAWTALIMEFVTFTMSLTIFIVLLYKDKKANKIIIENTAS